MQSLQWETFSRVLSSEENTSDIPEELLQVVHLSVPQADLPRDRPNYGENEEIAFSIIC
jgi:hypothetical protein